MRDTTRLEVGRMKNHWRQVSSLHIYTIAARP